MFLHIEFCVVRRGSCLCDAVFVNSSMYPCREWEENKRRPCSFFSSTWKNHVSNGRFSERNQSLFSSRRWVAGRRCAEGSQTEAVSGHGWAGGRLPNCCLVLSLLCTLFIPPRWGDFDVYNICPRLDKTCECRFIFIYIHSSFSVIVYIISIQYISIPFNTYINIKHQTSISISIYIYTHFYPCIYLSLCSILF